MAVSILEGLMNADHNLNSGSAIGAMFAKEQLHNCTVLLQKGYETHEQVEPLLEATSDGKVESVPEKEGSDD